MRPIPGSRVENQAEPRIEGTVLVLKTGIATDVVVRWDDGFVFSEDENDVTVIDQPKIDNE